MSYIRPSPKLQETTGRMGRSKAHRLFQTARTLLAESNHTPHDEIAAIC
jgi:hypothetical protein